MTSDKFKPESKKKMYTKVWSGFFHIPVEEKIASLDEFFVEGMQQQSSLIY